MPKIKLFEIEFFSLAYHYPSSPERPLFLAPALEESFAVAAAELDFLFPLFRALVLPSQFSPLHTSAARLPFEIRFVPYWNQCES